MIRIENLTFSFPTKDLYQDISFSLEQGQHCAFIGASGNGKSTLIEMILDQDKHHYAGQIHIEDKTRIGYMSQFMSSDQAPETSVFDFIAEDFLNYEKKIADICEQMATAEDIEPLLEAYQEALDGFQAIGGDDYESIIHKKLNLASLMTHRDLKISQISGGEFKLVQIMKEMLKQPHIMIMDEPDVFLDFENLEALKELINNHKGILLVITHNRYLLNHCFNKIIHLENKQLQEYNGSYIDYNFALLESKIELQELAIADQEEIERNEALIHQLRLNATYSAEAAKGRALRARVKYQERLEARRIQAPFVEIKQPYIEFAWHEDIETYPAITTQDHTIAFDQVLFEHASFEIQSTDKVALIGSNGTGKTSLLRQLVSGHDNIQVHPDTKLTYLSQVQGETLKDEDTVYDAFFEAGFESRSQIAAHLLNFGFDEEILYQPLSKFSGGERNLLQIAKVCGDRANMLLLDEPTSHLDTYAQMALERAIQDYPGGLIMVSHDYYTIANTVDYLLIIQDGELRKISNRKFRKMIYKNHYNKDYLILEQEKKTLETQIAMALKATKFKRAKEICDSLKDVIEKMKQ